jgi:methyltransferase (TIGR00027 family)
MSTSSSSEAATASCAGGTVSLPPAVPNVSDTARWVAVYRANETRRADALFRDPLAERLAGPRGRELAARLGTRDTPWVIIVRTRLIDELIAAALSDGVDRIVNLAAGLDTRPYRLTLPEDLVWIEADLPGMIEEKTRLLAGERPVCAVRRETLDLSDAGARGAFLAEALAGSRQPLVITEGLLVYLEASMVQSLGRDLHAHGAKWWIADLCSPRVLEMMQRHTNPLLDAGAQMRFGPSEGVGFFRPIGFEAREVRSFLREGARLHRLPLMLRPFAMLPDAPSDHPGRRPWSAVVRFERTEG